MCAATKGNEISLTQAALRIGMSYHRARTMMLRGELRGRQEADGRWYVLEEDVARLEHRRTSTTSVGAVSRQ
jgi:predicted site-specific integrase-resolvase